jgi:RNA polymerase sigma factor (sigma-70 family)
MEGGARPADRAVGRAEVVATSRPRSLEALYLAEWVRLVRFAALLVGDVSAAEDVVQDAFVKLSAKTGGGWGATFEVSYLRTAVMNTSRSVLRRRDVALRHAPGSQRAEGGADQGAIRAFEQSAIVSALGRLPRRQREALALRYYEGLSLAEIAATMGVTVGTVKSTLSKATRACAALVEDLR